MAIITNTIELPQSHGHLIRPRLNTLLAQAIDNPLTIVCAGMGCGKTRAVYDFTQKCAFPVRWLQFSDAFHPASHFWCMFVRAVAQTNEPFANELKKLGLPDTEDKLHMYLNLRRHMHADKRRLWVFDDFHLAKDTAVLQFLEQALVTSRKTFPLTSTILISRNFPSINISSLMVRNNVFMINEEELNFTESELHQFLLQQGLDSETNSLAKIYEDTKGWAFIINFVAQILKKTPGYAGYARGAIKQDIAQLIEAEAWNTLSERLKRFFIRLSLTPHRSMDLVNILAEGDESLIAEMKEQNAFIRYDGYTDAYRIHRLFLDFLHARQGVLPDDEIRNTYTTIADWCVHNDFIVDALFIYEKTGDYESIISILFASNVEFIENNASKLEYIFNRAPDEIFDRVDFSAAIHIHVALCNGNVQEILTLLQNYETRYLQLPEDNAFRNRMLGGIYYYWGILRMVLCCADDCYDFDAYFAKQCECLINFSVNPKCWYQHSPNLWTSFVGSSRAGAPQEYINALTRSMHYIQNCAPGLGMGQEDLCRGELFFYQGNLDEAESCIAMAIERARDSRQYEIVARALFLIMRIAVSQGDYVKLGLALKDAERQLAYNEYSVRFLTYDIITGWYYYILNCPEKIQGWLKEKFTYQLYKRTLEILGNYIKVKYFYMTNKYTDLLVYFEKRKNEHTILYERVELLALEACVHIKMRNKHDAIRVLHESYEEAQPNGIEMPFIELGKPMRTLIYLAAKCPDCTIPRPWLQSMQQKTSAYSRNQTLILSRYQRTHKAYNKIQLSPRETVIFHDLRAGLSRSEIAAKHKLSINTVKLHINRIYSKLGARNRADMLRIAAKNNLM